jgi:ribosomal protein L37E
MAKPEINVSRCHECGDQTIHHKADGCRDCGCRLRPEEIVNTIYARAGWQK